MIFFFLASIGVVIAAAITYFSTQELTDTDEYYWVADVSDMSMKKVYRK